MTPAWLWNSVKAGRPLPCENYVAIQDLREETIHNCPTCKAKPCQCGSPGSVDGREITSSSPSMALPVLSSPVQQSVMIRDHIPSTNLLSIPSYLLPPPVPISTNTSKLDHKSRYSCQRASPLVCPNQVLALEVDIIRRSRALEGEDRSALSYSRAISALKGSLSSFLSYLWYP